MEEAPDMDDLLDEMEADLISKTRAAQPAPPDPISMSHSVKVGKLLPNNMFRDNMQGEVHLNISNVPPIFKPEAIISRMKFVDNQDQDENIPQKAPTTSHINTEVIDEKKEITNGKIPTTVQSKESAEEQEEDIEEEKDVTNGKIEEFVKQAEVQPPQPVKEEPQEEEEILEENGVDSEYEEMLNYLNSCENEEAPNSEEAIRKAAGQIAEQVMESAVSNLEEDILEHFASSDSEQLVTVIQKTPDPQEAQKIEEDIVENVGEEEEVEKNDEETRSEGDELESGTTEQEDIEAESEDLGASEVVEAVEVVEEPEETEDANRPRFDSIATIHLLHESDSDESEITPRERRLTESELQLGKTCPYWIPDADCSVCMLCTSKFTIINRRHHCRACGRVLCGSCCSEKAILDYLIEPGKKPQPVRVCKPCSSMLARIEAHQQQQDVAVDAEAPQEAPEESTSAPVAPPPKGVLKMRNPAATEGDDNPTTSEGSAISEREARRSVVFRDGVRPGTQIEGVEQEEQRSTAIKPKKKSRKRQSISKRCAELRMEDELSCALPNGKRQSLYVVQPENDEIVLQNGGQILKKIWESSPVTIMLKKNLSCTLQIVDDPLFGLVWALTTNGFAKVGLDELFFSWTLSEDDKERFKLKEEITDETLALSFLPLSVLFRISMMFVNSTENEYAGVRRVQTRFSRLHSVPVATSPLPLHIFLFRPTVQNFSRFRTPTSSFLVACFLHDHELQWATACPERLLYRLGLKYGCYPTPIVNQIGREPVYSRETSGTALKMFTDFRSWTYRMRHLAGCTASVSTKKTLVRIPLANLTELKEIISYNRSMLAWRCDLSINDDSLLVCDETDPGIYTTQILSREGKRESTAAAFIVLDRGSRINSVHVSVIEDGITIRFQSELFEVILDALIHGNDIVETDGDMEVRFEFYNDDGENLPEFIPKSQIDGKSLMNKYQYGLSLERVLTQVIPVQGISDYGIRLSHVYNWKVGRLTPEEEPRIYSLIEIAAKECVVMLEPYMKYLIAANIESFSIRLLVTQNQIEYDVSSWAGLDEENLEFKKSLDQMIPMLYNMTEYAPSGFNVELVLSIVSTKPLPI